MKPTDRLDAARTAADEGRYEDALRDLVWFHEHALEEQPSLHGVRLSFALSQWIELGQVYPKALSTLESLRERKSRALLSGDRQRNLFHDVMAIDRSVGASARTHELFRCLAASDPDFARTCSDLALASIVAAGDFELAARFLPAPEPLVRKASVMLNQSITDLRERASVTERLESKLAAHARVYADEVQLVMRVLAGSGHQDDAVELRQLALALVDDDSIRDEVRTHLDSPSSSLEA